MTRDRIQLVILAVVTAALAVWIAHNTYWASEKIPMPLRGEAATNPFYIREKFAQALGARTQWAKDFGLPSDTGIAYVSSLDWNLLPERRKRFEKWVESGGRLVVDSILVTGTTAFQTWSGIEHRNYNTVRKKPSLTLGEECRPVKEDSSQESYRLCKAFPVRSLSTRRRAEWSLRGGDSGLEAVRVRIGRGTVTVIEGSPFNSRSLFSGENAQVFVAVTQLRRGDVIHFFAENGQPSLLALAWRLGWPVFVLTALVLALSLWRGSVRFGPLAAPTDSARRSLAEQIRGTGQFTMRIGSLARSGRSLHQHIRGSPRRRTNAGTGESNRVRGDLTRRGPPLSRPRSNGAFALRPGAARGGTPPHTAREHEISTWKLKPVPSIGPPSCSNV
jgi:hypothetical protein